MLAFMLCLHSSCSSLSRGLSTRGTRGGTRLFQCTLNFIPHALSTQRPDRAETTWYLYHPSTCCVVDLGLALFLPIQGAGSGNILEPGGRVCANSTRPLNVNGGST